jgi:hypothetical protein
VLDSEAPKLPIHTAIAVPQYGTQGSVGHLAALPIWRLSPLRTWIPATLGSATALDPPPETQPCAMSVNYVLVLVNRLAGASHCAIASKTAHSSGAIVRPYAAAWASAPASTAANASAIF